MSLQDSIQSGAIEQLTQANKQLEQQVLELEKSDSRNYQELQGALEFIEMVKSANAELEDLVRNDTDEILKISAKCKAWDDLDELINECRNENLIIAIKPNNSKQFFIVDSLENGGVFDCYIGFGMASVSNALVHIKGEG